MERVTFSNAVGTGLVGHYHAAATRNGIVLIHGFCNDKSSNGRFDTLATALHDAGMAVLAFDCGGCGESQDIALTPNGLRADIDAALAHMGSRGHDKLGLFGNSLGGSLCLGVSRPEIVAMAATGAATAPMAYDWSKVYAPEQLAELARTGVLIDPVDGRWRERVVVSDALLRAFGEGSQEQRLAGLTCPILLIYGNHPSDGEEQQLARMAREALPLLPHGSVLRVVEGAHHGLRDRWAIVVGLVLRWFFDRLRPEKDKLPGS